MNTPIIKTSKSDVSKRMKQDRLTLSKLFNTLCKDDMYQRDVKTGNILFAKYDGRKRGIKGTEIINDESIRTVLNNYIAYAKKNKGRNDAFSVLIEKKNFLLFKSLLTTYDREAAKKRNKNVSLEKEFLYSEYFALCLFNRLLTCSFEVYNLILQYFSTDNSIELQKLVDITFTTDSEIKKLNTIIAATEATEAAQVPTEAAQVQ